MLLLSLMKGLLPRVAARRARPDRVVGAEVSMAPTAPPSPSAIAPLVIDITDPAKVDYAEWRTQVFEQRLEGAGKGRMVRARELAPGIVCERGTCRASPQAPRPFGPVSNTRVSFARGQGLTFCSGCSDPHAEGGSWVDVWESHFIAANFHIHAGAHGAAGGLAFDVASILSNVPQTL